MPNMAPLFTKLSMHNCIEIGLKNVTWFKKNGAVTINLHIKEEKCFVMINYNAPVYLGIHIFGSGCKVLDLCFVILLNII